MGGRGTCGCSRAPPSACSPRPRAGFDEPAARGGRSGPTRTGLADRGSSRERAGPARRLGRRGVGRPQQPFRSLTNGRDAGSRRSARDHRLNCVAAFGRATRTRHPGGAVGGTRDHSLGIDATLSRSHPGLPLRRRLCRTLAGQPRRMVSPCGRVRPGAVSRPGRCLVVARARVAVPLRAGADHPHSGTRRIPSEEGPMSETDHLTAATKSAAPPDNRSRRVTLAVAGAVALRRHRRNRVRRSRLARLHR